MSVIGAVPETTAVPTTAIEPTSVKKENLFERFIDKLHDFNKKAAPIADEIANAAKPILALTPLGPEYNLALAGIETAVKADAATQAAAGTPLTNLQKMSLAVQVGTPGLTQILSTKGITEPPAVSSAIAQFVQNVYDLQTGPAVVTANK